MTAVTSPVRDLWRAFRATGATASAALRQARSRIAHQAQARHLWKLNEPGTVATRRHGRYTLTVGIVADVYADLSATHGTFTYDDDPRAIFIGVDRRCNQYMLAQWYLPADDWRTVWRYHRSHGVARGDAWLRARQEVRATVAEHRRAVAVTVTVTVTLRGVVLASTRHSDITPKGESLWDYHLWQVDDRHPTLRAAMAAAYSQMLALAGIVNGWDNEEEAAFCLGS